MDAPAAPGARIALDAGESRYLTRVCRARPGERVTATDGAGFVAALRLIEVGARVLAEVESGERVTLTREACVLCGAPEGERADWLVEKLAELGVRTLQPVDCRRAAWRRAAVRLERWRRIARAALRQSQRAHALEIRPPAGLDEALAAVPRHAERWLCTPAGALPDGTASPGPAVAVVGPSGGLDAAEEAMLLKAGFRPMRLSDGRLRTETAALSWAAWWASRPGATGDPPRSVAGSGLDASRGRP